MEKIDQYLFRCWTGLVFALAASAQAQPLEQCVPKSEGRHFTVKASSGAQPVSGVVIGSGANAVVFSNTAYNAPCDWLPIAREVAAKGMRAVLWTYAADGIEQIADLNAVLHEVRTQGAGKVLLVGGSRGGCLSMMAASEAKQPVAGVVILSCAEVFNRRNPTLTAPWARKLNVPLLHMTGENDAVPPVAQAQEEFKLFPVADKRLIVLPGIGAHGDQLLLEARAAAIAKPAFLEFLARVMQP